jgi:lysozyme
MVATPISLSDAGAKFITQPRFDSFVSKPYLDSGGLWTIGYGSRITAKQVIQFKEGITEAQALAMFQEYMQGLTTLLRKCPFAGLQQYQWDAIYSLCYNIGFEQFSTRSTIYKRLMCRSYDLSSWLEYVRDSHFHIDAGLVYRRQMELRLFIWGIY